MEKKQTNQKYRVPAEILPLIGGFLQRRDHDLTTMRSYYQKQDYAPILAIAHKMKGNGTSFGFPQLSELSAELEKAARVGNPSEIDFFLRELESTIRQIKQDFAS